MQMMLRAHYARLKGDKFIPEEKRFLVWYHTSCGPYYNTFDTVEEAEHFLETAPNFSDRAVLYERKELSQIKKKKTK